MNKRLVNNIVPFLVGVGVLACGAIQDPSDLEDGTKEVWSVLPGILEINAGQIDINVPDTVFVGSPVSVVVTTYGSGCFRKAATTVVMGGLDVFIGPFDSVVTLEGGNQMCPLILRRFQHTATVQFDEPGFGHFEINGRREPGDQRFSIFRPVVVLAGQ